MLELELQEMLLCLSKYKRWYVYGAGIVAYDISLALEVCYGIKPDAFLTSTPDTDNPFFHSEQVWCMDQLCEKDIVDCCVLIGTPEIYHDVIVCNLVSKGVKNYIPLTCHLEYQIMAAYYKKECNLLLLEDIAQGVSHKLSAEDMDLCIYMAKSSKDKPLKNQYAIPKYISPIQVGAELDCMRLEKCQDNSGENISNKNRNYSELTATYWVWKNTTHDYKGICHYRRIFLLPENIGDVLEQNNIDVILPLPYVCKNNASDQYKRYVSEQDFIHMMCALKEVSADVYNEAKRIYEERYLYNYNMVIAKKEVFDFYCEWLFKVLEQVEQYCDAQGQRTDRYAGYLGELLTSLYFMSHQDKYRIVHAERIWMC